MPKSKSIEFQIRIVGRYGRQVFNFCVGKLVSFFLPMCRHEDAGNQLNSSYQDFTDFSGVFFSSKQSLKAVVRTNSCLSTSIILWQIASIVARKAWGNLEKERIFIWLYRS